MKDLEETGEAYVLLRLRYGAFANLGRWRRGGPAGYECAGSLGKQFIDEAVTDWSIDEEDTTNTGEAADRSDQSVATAKMPQATLYV